MEDIKTSDSDPSIDANIMSAGLQSDLSDTCVNESNKIKHLPYQLPTILLTNLQSFGKPGKTDKTTELELVLELNCIDIGVFTETWATDDALKSLDFEDYNMFHSVRNNCSRASGGLSIFVKNTIPAKKVRY